MFSDSEVSVSGFSSNWRFSRESEDHFSQTSEVLKTDKNTQAVDSHTAGVQTESDESRVLQNKYDEDKLSAFLNKVCPEVVKELDRVSRSNAFASYSLTGDEEEEVRQVLTFTQDAEGVKVSRVSWSCTGSVLALALTHTLHNSWCSHQGQVVLYNVDRKNRSPVCTLAAPSCIRSISMHPYIPSILAAGTFSGEVIVWDTMKECVLTNVTNSTHSDSVTEVYWALGTGTQVTLVSSGLDGYLILWKVSPQLSSCHLIDRYCCDLTSGRPGITTFAFPYHKQEVFVVCLEGGAIYHCSTAVAKSIASVLTVDSSEVVKDPVISSFEPQTSTVTCVEFSPHLEDIFATAATDQAIRIYSLYQKCAQRIIWTDIVVGLSWNPIQAHILASWGHSNAVSVYNSNTGDILTSLSPDDNKHKAHLSSVCFNAKSPRLLAVGDLDGTVGVWEIPVHISAKSGTEIK